MLRSAALYLAIIFGTILVAEGGARIWSWQPPAWDATAYDGMGSLRYYHSPGGLGDLVPDQNGLWLIWSHRPYHVQTNSVGLRNTEEIAADSFKILTVGDSQTFGPYLANEDTWPAWSEGFLRQHYRGTRKIQVFNAGISGYSILDEFNYLREKGIRLKPDLVLIGVFENDVSDFRREKNGTIQRPLNDLQSRGLVQFKALVRSSALFSLAQQIKTRMQLASAGVDVTRGEAIPTRREDEQTKQNSNNKASAEDAAHVKRYQEVFRDTVTLLKQSSLPLGIIFIPDSNTADGTVASEVEPIIHALTDETGTPYLDLTPVMRGEKDPGERLYLLQMRKGRLHGNGHLSRAGAAVIGQAVADWLLSAKLVSH